MTEKTLTTENIKPALDALRGELAPWPVMAMKQDRLNDTQKSAVNSGITSSLVAQIIANTAAIRALESAITGTGLRALVVASLPAIGTTGILYIVPVTTYDPDTDADVVNYSNEYIWIPVEGGTASEGHYEQVGQTGIVINNGQLTITVNGTSVGTFTANQSGDTTAAITVPTNADYVDRTTDQTVAGVKTFSSTINGTAAKAIADEDGTSIKTGYVNVAGNQTVTGNKDWTGINSFAGLTIKDSVALANGDYGQALTYRDNQGSRHAYIQPYKNTSGVVNLAIGVDNIGSVQLNSSLIPYATNVLSLGSSSYQWSSVYAQTYYYNGTAWGLDKTNVWTGTNDYNQGLAYKDTVIVDKTIPSAYRAVDTFKHIGSDGAYWGGLKHNWLTDGGSQVQLCVANHILYNGTWTQGFWAVNFAASKDFSDIGFYPSNNNVINLGSSSYQWNKTYSKEYYYNGTAWGLDKSNTWTEDNQFNSSVSISKSTNAGLRIFSTALEVSATKGQPDLTSDVTLFIAFKGKTLEHSISDIVATANTTSTKTRLVSRFYTNSSTYAGAGIDLYASTASKYLAPTDNNTIDLGTSTNKWKSLNGINPGILNHVDASVTQVNIDTTGWVLDGSAWNTFNTSSYMDGWMYLSYMQCAVDDYISVRLGSTNYSKPTLLFKAEKLADNKYYIYATIPVTKKFNIYLEIKTSGTIVAHGLYPSLGNV